MLHSFWAKTLLFLAGVIAIAVGAAGLFWPVTFHASSGISLGDNASLLSELRAPAAMLLLAGGFILGAAFVARWRLAAIWVSAALYLAYGLTRVFSIALDGVPHDTLLMAGGLELAVGGICALMIWKSRTVTGVVI